MVKKRYCYYCQRTLHCLTCTICQMSPLLSKVAWLFMQPGHFLSQNVLIHCRVRIKTVGTVSVVANIASQLGIVGWLFTYNISTQYPSRSVSFLPFHCCMQVTGYSCKFVPSFVLHQQETENPKRTLAKPPLSAAVCLKLYMYIMEFRYIALYILHSGLLTVKKLVNYILQFTILSSFIKFLLNLL